MAAISGTVFRDHNQNGQTNTGDLGLPGWQVYLDEDEDGQYDKQAHTTTFHSANVPLELDDISDTFSELQIGELPARIGDLELTINVEHTHASNLTMWLISPREEYLNLTFNLGADGDNFTNTTFDDEAILDINQGSPPFTGAFRPSVPFLSQRDKTADGIWKLRIWDNTSGGAGRLLSWSLTITTGEPILTTNSAGNFSFANVPAGRTVLRQFDYPGWVQTRPAAKQFVFNLADDSNVTTPRFANDRATGSISGTKYHDANSNGMHDAGEAALPGWRIYLDLNESGSRDSGEPVAVTDAHGSYTFRDLEPRVYVVRDLQQPGWVGGTSEPLAVARPYQAVVNGLGSPSHGKAKPQIASDQEYAADRLVVQLARESSSQATAVLRAGIGATLVRHLGQVDMEVWQLPRGLSVTEAIERLWSHPLIESLTPDYLIEAASMIPNDPQFEELWSLHNRSQHNYPTDVDIDAPEAWATTTGNRAVLVAVLDSGVDYTHPELIDNIWTNWGEIPGNFLDDDANGYVDDVHGYDFNNDDGDPMDDWFHGTHVAGTIAAAGNNGIGIAGVNWQASIMAVKMLNSGGGGYLSAMISAIDYSTLMGAQVVNNSWGNADNHPLLTESIERARSAGILHVFAAGNHASSNDIYPYYPASFNIDNILAVAASDRNDHLAYFSNFGKSVDLAAPGDYIYSLGLNHGYRLASGTSMATPHVAGAAALLLAKNYSLTYQQLKDALMQTVDLSPRFEYGTLSGGRLNVNRALDSVPSLDAHVVRINPGVVATDLDFGARRVETMYFAAALADGQRELYASDGTPHGTGLLANLSGERSSDPRDFALLGDRMIFSATHTNGQRELFVTDGTASGSRLLADRLVGLSFDPREMTPYAGQLFFSGVTRRGERELFASDGNPTGTRFVKDVSGVAVSSDPSDFVEMGGRLYFTARRADGQRELYATDGTTEGTVLVVNLAGNISADPGSPAVFNGRLYFSAATSDGQRELYSTDGSAPGTVLVQDTSGATSADPSDLVALGSQLIFSATTATGQRELHRTDGTAAGTSLLANLSGTISSDPREMTLFAGQIYFTALRSDGLQRELHVTDGTVAGTRLLRDLANTTSSSPGRFTVLASQLFFTAMLANGLERELFSTDGTTVGTKAFRNLAGDHSSDPSTGLSVTWNEVRRA